MRLILVIGLIAFGWCSAGMAAQCIYDGPVDLPQLKAKYRDKQIDRNFVAEDCCGLHFDFNARVCFSSEKQPIECKQLASAAESEFQRLCKSSVEPKAGFLEQFVGVLAYNLSGAYRSAPAGSNIGASIVTLRGFPYDDVLPTTLSWRLMVPKSVAESAVMEITDSVEEHRISVIGDVPFTVEFKTGALVPVHQYTWRVINAGKKDAVIASGKITVLNDDELAKRIDDARMSASDVRSGQLAKVALLLKEELYFDAEQAVLLGK